jgi:hypothetical protein
VAEDPKKLPKSASEWSESEFELFLGDRYVPQKKNTKWFDEKPSWILGKELGFRVVVDPGSATSEEIAEVFDAISELNRADGGDGMTFSDPLSPK